MDITEPTLLLNKENCKNNIQQMAEKAQRHQLEFKPHMKTHQSAEIGEWLRDNGVQAITVSSVTMAEYFCEHGWQDITIAFPCNVRQIDRINILAEKATLTLLVNSSETTGKLDENLTSDVKVYIELDTESNRTGLKVSQQEEIESLIKTINDSTQLKWIGFYSHPGHSYDARTENEIRQIQQSVLSQIENLRENITSDYRSFEVCIGDTPCCSKGQNFEGIDAISPGNFVFYDLMQVQIGSCNVSDIAVAVACPVVDRYPERNELAIHGGAVHFSKESLQMQNVLHYGMVASGTNNPWEVLDNNSYLNTLSQEHGLIKCSKEVFDRYQVGDLVIVLPVHSCLTANLMNSYQLEDGRTIDQF